MENCSRTLKIKWTDVGEKSCIVRINDPVEGSNARIVKVPLNALAMINSIPRQSDCKFNPNADTMRKDLQTKQKNSRKTPNPKLNQIARLFGMTEFLPSRLSDFSILSRVNGPWFQQFCIACILSFNWFNPKKYFPVIQTIYAEAGDVGGDDENVEGNFDFNAYSSVTGHDRSNICLKMEPSR